MFVAAVRKSAKVMPSELPDAAPQESSLSPVIQLPRTPLTGDKQIFVRDGERCWLIRVGEIVLLESEGNYTRVHFGSRRAMLYRSLRDIQQRLDPAQFFRANRHNIINLQYVNEIAPWVNGGFLVRLTSGSQIQVSRRQAQLLKRQMAL